MRGVWNRWFLKYFDVNQNESVDWWEFLIPIMIILVFEIIANVIANIITG